ncbi:hypothetical protein Tco_1248931, partial [Tanacetum coccineum]
RTATTPYEAVKTKLKDETDPPVNVHLLLFFNVAACFVAAGYLVSAGTCFCCYSILLLCED